MSYYNHRCWCHSQWKIIRSVVSTFMLIWKIIDMFFFCVWNVWIFLNTKGFLYQTKIAFTIQLFGNFGIKLKGLQICICFGLPNCSSTTFLDELLIRETNHNIISMASLMSYYRIRLSLHKIYHRIVTCDQNDACIYKPDFNLYV